MATVQTLENKLEAKLKVVEITRKSVDALLNDGNVRECERKFNLLDAKLNELDELKDQILEAKIIDGMEESEAETYGSTIDDRLAAYVTASTKLKTFLDESKQTEMNVRHQEELKRKTELESVKPTHVKTDNYSNAKLPKLQIAPFEGVITDFLRFWNTFVEEVDNKPTFPATTKFSYLKEYLGPKVRPIIESLPFTTEGYTRAKMILTTKYGKTSEIVNAHVTALMALPTIKGTNPNAVNDFYETLTRNVQALETMKKLESVNGYTRMLLDRVPHIRSDLVRDDDNWHDWKLPNLVESLRKWTERNPITSSSTPYDPPHQHHRNNQGGKHNHKLYQTNDATPQFGPCVYCGDATHKATSCGNVTTTDQRRNILSNKKLCFNCCGKSHQASKCRSTRNCAICNGRHHTSICDGGAPAKSTGASAQPMMMSAEEKREQPPVYPMVVVKIMGVQCRAVLDTLAGSSYVSAGLIDYIKAKKSGDVTRDIEMMFCTKSQKMSIYKLDVHDNSGNLVLRKTEFSKVDRHELLKLPNPKYEQLKRRYSHLQPVIMDDMDTKPFLPVHIILGTGEYNNIKTATAPLLGNPGEPTAELTKLGWTMMSPGESIKNSIPTFLTKHTTAVDFEELCRIDVLGVQDVPDGDQTEVLRNFEEQVTRLDDGRYETGLLWKPNHPPLPTNEAQSKARLRGVLRKTKSLGILEEYDEIIQEQLREGIVERVPENIPPKGERECYLGHRPVIREDAKTTKIRMIFDGSARENESAPSLNDCLETGPPLQNLLWDVIVRCRFFPIVLTGDMKKAFLQVSIREVDRDALRFHWVDNLQTLNPIVLRFARALFGLNQSPFILGAVVREHLKSCAEEHPELVRVILLSLYIDDLIKGGFSVDRLQTFRTLVSQIFGDAKFTLHKWQSNVPLLEASDDLEKDSDSTYAKQKFGEGEEEGKLLGLGWNKTEDTLSVNIPERNIAGEHTKRTVLQFLPKVFDPLGFGCPALLVGKIIFKDICQTKIGWDTPLPDNLRKRWQNFVSHLPDQVTVPRSVTLYRENIIRIDLHAFGDASKDGTAAALYAVVHQGSGTSQGLICAKSRISKQRTIPQLELIASLMAANMMNNVVRIVKGIEGVSLGKIILWSDSTTALHWIRGDVNKYKQFVRNTVTKIRSNQCGEWRHVPGELNPADIASRGAKVDALNDLWWRGPQWLPDEGEWPLDIETKASQETENEAKLVKQVFGATVETRTDTNDDAFVPLITKFDYKKTIRITAWVRRFCHNIKQQQQQQQRRVGPLTTEEIAASTHQWIASTQRAAEKDSNFSKWERQLNIQKDDRGVYVCVGRIQGHYPIFLPSNNLFSEKLVMHAHKVTMHGGVGLTMTYVREGYWIPQLRKIAKRVRDRCHGCKRSRAVPLGKPPVANLPLERTEGSRPFEVVGLDYAGPFYYRASHKREAKAYLILYTCSLTRALHLEILPDQTADNFIPSLKRLIARKGRPRVIYSDNAQTFLAASKWLKRVLKNEKTHDFLATNDIQWKFNMSRAPWWGGQFERMVGLVKQSIFKVIGKSSLSWNELSEVIIDAEVTLNNRPLSYVEDDIDLPVLTPNMMMFGPHVMVPESDPNDEETTDLRRRARYVLKCKARIWDRWRNEYLRGLRERHNMSRHNKSNTVNVGDVMLIKGDDKNRSKWKMGIIIELISGKDNVNRGAILKTFNGYLERAVQHLYPMELHCDIESRRKNLNADAPEFRPKRTAAKVSELLTGDQLLHGEEEPAVE